ncbi:MAG: Era-like GTP-binding protein [Candidatus Micrarchaeia archaeon]
MLKKILNFFRKLLFRQKNVKLGFYGSTNVGKTTLANRMAVDLVGEPVGQVSPVPHETRAVMSKERVELKTGGYSLVMNILDMPGIAVKVDYRDFMEYGLGKKEAQERAKEATRGIVEAVKWLEDVDAALVVVDSTEDPYNQINITLLGNLEARNIPFLIVANKIDLPGANTKRVREVFPSYPIVEVSAATGENMELLYDELAIHLL